MKGRRFFNGLVMVVVCLFVLFVSSAFPQDSCEGDFDCDSDCDGTDAAVFKLDFGRSSFNNPCPPCSMGLVPGMLMMWAGSIAAVPEGWMLCDGSEVSRTEYPDLFAAVGVIYGEGDGANTFNLPNFVNQSPMGASDDLEGAPMTSVEGTLTQAGGEPEHTLDINQMPYHGHGVNDPGHVHTYPIGATYPGSGNYAARADSYMRANNTSARPTGISLASTGGSQPHNNLHPYFATGYIIFAGTQVTP